MTYLEHLYSFKGTQIKGCLSQTDPLFVYVKEFEPIPANPSHSD